MIKTIFKFFEVIILCAVMVLLSESFCSAGETNAAPEKFNVYIGGFLGTSYRVELENGVLKYSEMKSPKEVETTLVKPSPEQWANFRRELDKTRIWNWKTNYSNSNTLDGTQWSIEIQYPDCSLTARGDNNYPESSGKPNGKPEPTKTFNTYLAAVQKLLGGKDFK